MKLAQVPASAFQSGKQIRVDHYVYNTNDLIGSGFSSQVYKGKDENTNEIVAIKIIDHRKITNEVERSLLQQEINALQIMQSPNILKMIEYIQKPECTYIITEYCNQGDLGKLIKRKQQIDETEAIKIFKHVINGFREQIQKGVIHRDLKPINILIKNGVPKIADYGFSKMMNAPPETVYYNVGTALYMSPQTMIKNTYSEKTDVWSLGVMFYEMLYGTVPFSANSEKDLAQVILRTQPHFPQNRNISRECIDLILQCLTVDENRRISCSELEQHPIFFRRYTMTGPRPITVNNRSTSIRHGNNVSPQRFTEYGKQCKYIPTQGVQRKTTEKRKQKSNDEIMLTQLNFMQLMLLIIRILDKEEILNNETQIKLKFLFIKNLFMKSIQLKELIEKKKNTLHLQDFDSFIEVQFDQYQKQIYQYFNLAKEIYDNQYTNIESAQELKIALLRDRCFCKVYENFKNVNESYEFYLLFSAQLSKSIRDLCNRCQQKLQYIPDHQQLNIHEEAMVYLLELLTYYYMLVKIILEQHNNIQIFTEKAKIQNVIRQTPQSITKGNLVQVRQSILDLKI